MGQDEENFHPPLKIPIYLSGNFGELRSNHFHSGIDIKTQGTTGHHVFAVEEGYVSRIKVQANGYGKSIYITHPNGYTSVYGHLNRYRDDIAAFVKKMQYKKQSHTVDLYLDRSTFSLDKGEFIAYSGNTGGSMGPHLHFELRSSSNQHPVNVLKFNFNIKDNVPPRFLSINLYPMDKNSQVNQKAEKFSSKLLKDNGIYTVPYGTKISAAGTLGISVEVFDYLDGASNRCGIYTLKMYVDDKLSYSHQMDEFSFAESRYINAHTDYEANVSLGVKAHRLHRLPNDRLSIYSNETKNAALLIHEMRDYQIRIEARDVAGNEAVLEFTLKGNRKPAASQDAPEGFVSTMPYSVANTYKEGPVRIVIPANALYRDMDFCFRSSSPTNGSLTPFYHIGNPEVPVHTAYTLSIQSPDIDAALHSKLLLITRNDKNEIEAAGGEYHKGAVVAKLRSFGNFAIATDTISPEIKPLWKGGADLHGKRELRFNILDNLSGIEKYDGYIDNQWALFEYDPKNDLLSYRFDEEHITSGSTHELELYLRDTKGNTSLLHTTFNW